MRKSLIAVAAAGLTLSLAACSGGTTPGATSSPSGDVSSPAASAPAGSGTVTIWVDETRVETFNTIGEGFTAATGVTLDVVQKPTGDIKTDFIAQAPTGEGPDLIVGAHDWVGDLQANGVIAPVELGDKVSGFNELAIQGFTYDGQLFGVPYAIENIALVRNNGMVSDTPATFDELIAQGKAVEGAQFPIVIQQGDAGDAYHLYPIQTSFGAPVFKTDASGAYTAELGMGGPEGLAFANYLKKLADEKVVSVSLGGDQAKQAFIDQKTPYMITGPWNIADFEAAGIDVSVLAVPSAGGQPSAPFLGVQGVYLSSQSENALVANQFLDYMASKEAQDKLYELGGRTPALTESADAVDDPILAGFAEAGKEGQPMPALPEMGAVWTFWGSAQVSIITGAAAPEAAWTEMIANIESKF
ncbi:arabinogalactan oligomer / maltooligosaccharide transport system substrate-binding protein [Tessaracoccus bendigoensis DSM 12906]|uniref:Arabinogalactan oligomer / maltooligosaccharide transport system substrate-binding protein n=1 Tax=Tessaracoccus bendigoensis DSM 12906 TaxID=1123357 RepID=A0A1M6IIA6_9ACTN|nr:extracellular solute-binding protein [Tessaracoccus bendigoensis]SHJ34103.1 arabinogalactan oligomer / maltooligosaccharide transport system substrate-binding protein [Tessaracoccus bendigoensis DSM 12906]